MAWPFLEPVNPDDVPEYNDVIADPIGKLPLLVLVLLGHRLFFSYHLGETFSPLYRDA